VCRTISVVRHIKHHVDMLALQRVIITRIVSEGKIRQGTTQNDTSVMTNLFRDISRCICSLPPVLSWPPFDNGVDIFRILLVHAAYLAVTWKTWLLSAPPI
jgi:hypothetical protein